MTAGATEALSGGLLALLDTGDEVVLFEPMYDCYAAGIAMAGGVARPVPLRPPPDGSGAWTFDEDEVRAAITPRATILLLNTPHNPDRQGLHRRRAAVPGGAGGRPRPDRAHRRGLRAPRLQRRAAPLDRRAPGHARPHAGRQQRRQDLQRHRLEDRLDLRPGAAGAAVRTAKQFLTYVNGGPFQPAVAAGLGLPDEYFAQVARISSTAATSWSRA